MFAHQWSTEGIDGTMRLDEDQDALIAALGRANPKTIVVLETGGPVLMPWIDQVPAVLEAWYPGSNAGEAIARVLTGEVNPSGRLPLTFPRSLDQLPRPQLDGFPDWVINEADYDFALSADSRHTVAHVKVHVARQVL